MFTYRRFIVFESMNYEAGGGMYDTYKSFDGLMSAVNYASGSGYDNVHILDCAEGHVVWENGQAELMRK